MISSKINKDAPEELQAWQKRVDASEKKWAPHIKRIKDNRRYAVGIDDKGEVTSPANIILATNQTNLPHIYAKNPDVSVRPSKRAGTQGEMYESARLFAETAEIVVSREAHDADLKNVMKAIIRAEQTSSVGILKASYQTNIYEDPIIKNRINDTQDNISRLQMLIKRMDEDDQDSTQEAMDLAQAEQLMSGLEENLEVKEAVGLVYDRLKVDDFAIDPAIDDLYEYVRAEWMGHRTYMTDDAVMSNYDVCQEDLKTWQHYEASLDDYKSSDAKNEKANHLCVWEIWHHATNSVWTWAVGGDKWLRDPYRPKTLGKRWYPFFLKGGTWVDGFGWPLSDVEQLKSLQDEYSDTRKQQKAHRKMNMPYLIADADTVDEKDIGKMVRVAEKEILLISFNGQDPRRLFSPGATVPYNPAVYDTSAIRAEVGWLSGSQDAARGGIIQAKTATEANIQQASMGSRTGERQDATEDWLTDVFVYSLQILLQNMSSEDAKLIAGPDAFWPDVQKNKEEIYSLVEIEIRAGSTSKPDKALEQQNWKEIMPIFSQMIGFVLQLRQQEIPDKENPYYQLLDQTLSRYDERLDIETIIPAMTQPQQPGVQQPIGGQTNGQ